MGNNLRPNADRAAVDNCGGAGVKTCTNCQQTKPHSEFGRKPLPHGCRFGLASRCRACINASRRVKTPAEKQRERAALRETLRFQLAVQRAWRVAS